MNRTLNVIRMQLVNRQTFVWIPLIILGGSLVITLAVYGMISSAGVQTALYGGGAQAPLWYFGVAGSQALIFTFPFSQAMSVTRREFAIGTMLTAILTAAMLAIVFVIGGLVEQATGGWGINGYFFYLPWVWEAGPLAAGFVFFSVAMLFFIIGFWAATIYKRLGGIWLTTILVSAGLLLVAAAWLAGRLDAWGRIGEWIGSQGALGLALWALLPIAALAASAFATLRRVVP